MLVNNLAGRAHSWERLSYIRYSDDPHMALNDYWFLLFLGMEKVAIVHIYKAVTGTCHNGENHLSNVRGDGPPDIASEILQKDV